MSYYLKSGKSFRVSSRESMDLHERLPAGNYVVKEDQFGNLYLESIDNFEIQGRRYGNNDARAERILKTFSSRDKSTGVLLTGTKGSGKTLLAKSISLRAAELGIPTIVINAPWVGDKFNSFIQSIEDECVILFDEFEKVYDNDDQEHILTLLDGVFPSRKLFILTCNDKWRIDSNMRNRPGRIFYMIDFAGLSIDFIREYCQDNLLNKTYIDRVCNLTSLFGEFNFDMLKSLVEEMNRYDEDPQAALEMLNIKAEYDDGNRFEVKLLVNGDEYIEDQLDEQVWNGNPLQNKISIHYKSYTDDTDEDDDDGDVVVSSTGRVRRSRDWNWEQVMFTGNDLVKVEPSAGRFIFTNRDGVMLTLTRVREKRYNYYAAF